MGDTSENIKWETALTQKIMIDVGLPRSGPRRMKWETHFCEFKGFFELLEILESVRILSQSTKSNDQVVRKLSNHVFHHLRSIRLVEGGATNKYISCAKISFN